MQFNTLIPLPPGFTTPPLTIPVNDLNNPGYGAILRITEITGDFQVLVSLNSNLPLNYHRDYHYYHRTGPNSIAGWTERLAVNSNGVMEIYSTGPTLDIIIWYKDNIFKRFNHKEMQISIKTKGRLTDSDGNTVDPPLVHLKVHPPEPITEVSFLKYQNQYRKPLILNPSSIEDLTTNLSPITSHHNTQTSLISPKGTIPSTSSVSSQPIPSYTITYHLDSDDDDDRLFGVDNDNSRMNENTTIGHDNGYDPDFDDEIPLNHQSNMSNTTIHGGGDEQQQQQQQQVVEGEEDDPFADSDDDNDKNQNNSRSPAVGTAYCDNCHEIFPSAAIIPHSTQCKLRLIWCDICQRTVLKTMGHTHCDECKQQTTYAYLSTHKENYHEPIYCECNEIKLQEHVDLGLDYDCYEEMVFPYSKLAQHYNTCICKEERCQYCKNWFIIASLPNHLKRCKNTEAKCKYCDQTLTISKINIHYITVHGFDITKTLPNVEKWREDNYYRDTSAEQSQYRLPQAHFDGIDRLGSLDGFNNSQNLDYYQRQEIQINTIVLQHLNMMGIHRIEDADPEMIEDIKRGLLS